jgi:hypothetical protein
MNSLPFPVHDGDQPMYEAADAFTRYPPGRFKGDFYFVRLFGFEKYDAFWARCAEAGIFVCRHGSDSGCDRITGWWSGGHGEYRPFIADTFRATVDLIGGAISDSLSALICHGVFDRHPGLKVYSVENGSSWV